MAVGCVHLISCHEGIAGCWWARDEAPLLLCVGGGVERPAHQLPWDYRPQSTVSWRMINDSLSWWDDGIYSNHLCDGWHRALPGVRIAWVVRWVLRTGRLSSPLGPTHANHHKFKQSLARPGSRLLISCNKITIEMFTSTKLPQDRWRASSHFRI